RRVHLFLARLDLQAKVALFRRRPPTGIRGRIRTLPRIVIAAVVSAAVVAGPPVPPRVVVAAIVTAIIAAGKEDAATITSGRCRRARHRCPDDRLAVTRTRVVRNAGSRAAVARMSVRSYRTGAAAGVASPRSARRRGGRGCTFDGALLRRRLVVLCNYWNCEQPRRDGHGQGQVG